MTLLLRSVILPGDTIGMILRCNNTCIFNIYIFTTRNVLYNVLEEKELQYVVCKYKY